MILYEPAAFSWIACLVAALLTGAAMMANAFAGPPYVTDDPQPTDDTHFEIYAFGSGTVTRDGIGGAGGIDFNYGALPDLQLTAVLPIGYNTPSNARTVSGVGNAELAAKYRFLHQETFGWDVAIFPRFFAPGTSHGIGDRHGSFLLPLWLEKDWDDWATFGGGGCAYNRGGGSKDYCLASWALTRQVLPALRLGAEIYHQTADTKDGRSTTGVNAGLQYDITENDHLLVSAGPGIQNARRTNQFSWYAAMLFTF
jgi:hypothetical protein